MATGRMKVVVVIEDRCAAAGEVLYGRCLGAATWVS